jgi:hypothetical protein
MGILDEMRARAVDAAAYAAASPAAREAQRKATEALLDAAEKAAASLPMVPRGQAGDAIRAIRGDLERLGDLGREGLVVALQRAAMDHADYRPAATLDEAIEASDGASVALVQARDADARMWAAAGDIAQRVGAGAARAALPLLLGVL